MITEEIHIQMDVEGTLFNQFEFETYMCGYHASMDIWLKALIGEILSCEIEPGNKHDINAVAAIREGAVVGHVPMMLSEVFH